MWNMPSGLWPIVDTICPAAFGDFWDFATRYCDAKPGPYGWSASGSSHGDELESRLSTIMLRRTWREIQPDLPGLERTIEYVELTSAQHDAITSAAADLRRDVAQGQAQTVVGNLARLRRLYAAAKIQRAVELVHQTLADGHSVIVWTWHRDVADKLSKQLKVPFYGPLHGQTSADERERVIETARADRTAPTVLIATMGAFGTAVSLSWASHQVFVELDWTPAVIQQAEMRPFDGTRAISTVFLVADCDTDRRQADALITKLTAATTLGLKASAGDVAHILGDALEIAPEQSLDSVAALIAAGEAL
jgi:hypothetical protein